MYLMKVQICKISRHQRMYMYVFLPLVRGLPLLARSELVHGLLVDSLHNTFLWEADSQTKKDKREQLLLQIVYQIRRIESVCTVIADYEISLYSLYYSNRFWKKKWIVKCLASVGNILRSFAATSRTLNL